MKGYPITTSLQSKMEIILCDTRGAPAVIWTAVYLVGGRHARGTRPPTARTNKTDPLTFTHLTTQTISRYMDKQCIGVCPGYQDTATLCLFVLMYAHVRFVESSHCGPLTFRSLLNHSLHVTRPLLCSCGYRLQKLIEKMPHEIMQKIALIYIFMTSQGYAS